MQKTLIHVLEHGREDKVAGLLVVDRPVRAHVPSDGRVRKENIRDVRKASEIQQSAVDGSDFAA